MITILHTRKNTQLILITKFMYDGWFWVKYLKKKFQNQTPESFFVVDCIHIIQFKIHMLTNKKNLIFNRIRVGIV